MTGMKHKKASSFVSIFA